MSAAETESIESHAREALRRGDLEAARAGFARLAAGSGTRAAGCYGLALVLDRQWRRSDALMSMKEAVAADPRHANAFYYLGLWTSENDPDRAVDYLRSCLHVAPSHAGARTLLAKIPRPQAPPAPQQQDRATAFHPVPTASPPPSVTPPAAASEQAPLRPPREPNSWDALVGFVVDQSERAEGRSSSAFGVRVYELVVQGVDANGCKTLIESVEMRGAGRIGIVTKGQWVEIDRSRMKGRNGASVARLRNLTTGQDVVVRGVWSSASGRRGVYVVLPLVMAAALAGGMWWAIHRGAEEVGTAFLTVPDVSAQKVPALAVQQLKAAGFTSVMTMNDTSPDSAQYAVGSVEGTHPPAGSQYPSSMTVDVVVAAPPSTSAPAPTSAPPAPTPSGTGGSSTEAPVNCANDQIQTSEGRQIAANGVVLLFTNVSSRACILAGYPGVQLVVAGTGQRVDVSHSLRGQLGGIPAGSATYPRPVLFGGAVASAVLESVDAAPAPSATTPPSPAPPAPVTPTQPPTSTPTRPPPVLLPGALTVSGPVEMLPVGRLVSPVDTSCPTFSGIAVIAPNTSRTTLLTPGITGCAPTVHPVVAGVNGG